MLFGQRKSIHRHRSDRTRHPISNTRGERIAERRRWVGVASSVLMQRRDSNASDRACRSPDLVAGRLLVPISCCSLCFKMSCQETSVMKSLAQLTRIGLLGSKKVIED